MFRSPTPVVKNILIINIALFAIPSIVNLPINEWFALYPVISDNFKIYQFFTYMWLHGDLRHIFWNMIMVYFLGPLLEQVWGSKRFTIFYIVCGIGAGILYGGADYLDKNAIRNDAEVYLESPSPEAFQQFIIENKGKMSVRYRSYMTELLEAYEKNPQYLGDTIEAVSNFFNQYVNFSSMVGASGALYGLLFAFAYLFPNTEFYIYFLFPVKAKYLAFVAAMISIYSEFNRTPGDNVAHLAHLGGMVIAFILLKFWQDSTKRFY